MIAPQVIILQSSLSSTPMTDLRSNLEEAVRSASNLFYVQKNRIFRFMNNQHDHLLSFIESHDAQSVHIIQQETQDADFVFYFKVPAHWKTQSSSPARSDAT